MLIVKIEDAQMYLVLWKWSEEDFNIPLKITLPDSTASVFLDDPDRGFSTRPTPSSSRRRRRHQWVLHSTMLFQFENPTDDLMQGLLRPRSDKAEGAAKKIHDCYLQCVDTVVTYSRLHLGVHSILEGHHSDLFDLFQGKFGRNTNVSWSLDGKTFTPFAFKPKSGRKINPAFKSKSLIKPADWARLQRTVSNGQIPPDEVKELLKLRSNVFWKGGRRVSIVESAAIIEMALKNVVSNSLQRKGVSKARLDSLREEAGLSIFLNFMLPLSLSNPTLRRVLPLIQKIDKLRKLRNQIMHENLPEQDINQGQAYEGIDSCIRLIMYLVRLRKWVPSIRVAHTTPLH